MTRLKVQADEIFPNDTIPTEVMNHKVDRVSRHRGRVTIKCRDGAVLKFKPTEMVEIISGLRR